MRSVKGGDLARSSWKSGPETSGVRRIGPVRWFAECYRLRIGLAAVAVVVVGVGL